MSWFDMFKQLGVLGNSAAQKGPAENATPRAPHSGGSAGGSTGPAPQATPDTAKQPERVQSIVDNAGSDVKLRPDEYEGPLVIDHPCVIDASGATIWHEDGPVVIVRAPRVVIRNARLEVTGDRPGIALETDYPDTVLDEVEVRGSLKGLNEDGSTCYLPRTLHLGTFASDTINTFAFDICVPARARVTASTDLLRVEPRELDPGDHRIVVTVAPCASGVLVYGEIFVQTSVRRRIYVQGRAMTGAPKKSVQKAPMPPAPAVPRRASNPSPGKLPSRSSPGSPAARPSAAQPGTGKAPHPVRAAAPTPGQAPQNIRTLQKGERVDLAAMTGGRIRIMLEAPKRAADIDAYLFALGKNGKTARDEDLVFFGNRSLDRGDAVRIADSRRGPGGEFVLSQVPENVDRIAVVFAVYAHGGGAAHNAFSGCRVLVEYDSKPKFAFDVSHLPDAQCLLAAELYRYKGSWRLRCIAQELRESIEQVCTSYGVDVAG